MARRRFGSICMKPNKQHPKHIEARFSTPTEAFDKWPGLPPKQVKTFALDAMDDAVAWLAQQERLIKAGVWEPQTVVKRKDVAERITFGEYAPVWLERRRYRGRPLAAGTQYRLGKDIENHLMPFFGPMRMCEITSRTVDDWLDWLPADQPAMRANALKAAHSIFATAMKPGEHGEPPIVTSNPFDGRTSGRYRRETETPPVTPMELRVIFDAMPPRYAPSVLLAVAVEMRIGEVCALRWGVDLDLDAMVVHIRHGRLTMGSEKIGRPKTDSSVRSEPIPRQLAQALRVFGEQAGIKDGDFLFPAIHDPSQPLHPNVLRRWFRAARHEAGRDDLRFHDLRATGLTWKAMEGATLKELMVSGGHSDPGVAMIYQRAADGRRRELADKVGERMMPSADGAKIVELSERIESLQRELAALRGSA